MGVYINSKLGDAKEGKKAFPVRCPECWMYGFNLDDSLIEKVVSVETFEEWKHWKLVDSIPKVVLPFTSLRMLRLTKPGRDLDVLPQSAMLGSASSAG